MGRFTLSLSLLKMIALLLFCFVVGGWMVYDGIANTPGPVTFEAVYPGVCAILAGVLLIGLMLYITRPRPGDQPSTHAEPPDVIGGDDLV